MENSQILIYSSEPGVEPITLNVVSDWWERFHNQYEFDINDKNLPDFLVQYAECRHGRWREAESIIIKNIKSAFRYAITVIQGTWKEFEETVQTNSYYAYKYSLSMMQPWNKAEGLFETLEILNTGNYAFIDVTNLNKEMLLALDHHGLIFYDRYNNRIRITYIGRTYINKFYSHNRVATQLRKKKYQHILPSD